MMKNKKGKILRYSNRNHLYKTKRIKYQKRLERYKKSNGITDIELELCKYNSKSCTYETFKAYVKKKNEVNEKLLEKYEDDIFRKQKWNGYINRQKAETDLIRNIKETFGKDTIPHQLVGNIWRLVNRETDERSYIDAK